MLVLFTALVLLVGAPAVLLVAGRGIARWTDFEARRVITAKPAAPETGEAWYFRRMRPAFEWNAEDAGERSAPEVEAPPR